MTDYPFLVKGKVKKVQATSYTNALDRVLYKNRNIFIQTKFARRMSLIEAEQEAKAASKSNKKGRYFVVTSKGGGEADVSSTIKTNEIAHSVFVAGKKDTLTELERNGATAVPDRNLANKPTVEATRGSMSKTLERHAREAAAIDSNKTINKIINKVMTTTKKATPAKKATVPATKAAKAPATKPAAPKAAKEKTLPRGNNMFLTAAEWAKVDALLAKKDVSFSAWSRGLVQAEIK